MSSDLVTGDNTSARKNKSKVGAYQHTMLPTVADTSKKAVRDLGKSVKDMAGNMKRVVNQANEVAEHMKKHVEDKLNNHAIQTKASIGKLEAQVSLHAKKHGGDVAKLKRDVADAHKKCDSETDKLKKKHNDDIARLEVLVGSLTSKIDHLTKRVALMEGSKKKDYIHLGKDAFVPPQPESKKSSGGVWETAPLAASINGGLSLFNIGYTKKKGYDVTIDKDSGRLMLYTPK